MNSSYSQLLTRLVVSGSSKIVLIVLDGLGGLPREPGGKTELETAHTPNMDELAQDSTLGLSMPAGPGITVGSGPGHLALFGYDPIQNEIGRGALEALGVDLELGPDDLAARGNFCTLDVDGLISDRRAGRIPTDEASKLVALLQEIRIAGVEVVIRPVKEHRFAVVFRGSGLADRLSETDPQKTGVAPLPVQAANPESKFAARVANQFIEQARSILESKQPANMVLLRGFAKLPALPKMTDLYGLHPAAIALHGMYRGVSKLAGMAVLPIRNKTLDGEFDALEECWSDFDFFYLHVKKTDTCGESGDFEGKARAIEEVDAQLPRLLALQPNVVIITGDHSSPAVMRSHSWHPVPVLLHSKVVRPDGIAEFGERACARGSLGVLPATGLIPLALANAGRIAKYGA